MTQRKKKEGVQRLAGSRLLPTVFYRALHHEGVFLLWFSPRVAYPVLLGSGVVFALALLWQATLGFSQEPAQAVGNFERQSYQVSERPQFTVVAKAQIFRTPSTPNIRLVTLTDSRGRKQPVTFQTLPSQGVHGVTVAVNPPADFQPGRYEASVITQQDGKSQTFSQNFNWGVLALNVPSATVEPWHDVPLHLAVLDDRGGMVCDANVSIVITTPAGKKELFRTGDVINNKWRIRTNPACAVKARTQQPDYEAHYRPIAAGTYSVHVIADTKNGRRELTDAFRVQDHVSLVVQRNTFPTRIYPAAAYPVEFVVHPSVSYHGTLTEVVPASFLLSGISGDGSVHPAIDGKRSITWNVNWQAGQEYKLGYTFDAPDTSPAFYQLGPFVAGSTVEARQWQIASDATKTWDGGGGADTNWSNALNWSDDAVPDSSSDIVFSGSSNNNSVWDASATGTVNSVSITTYTGTLTITGPSSAAAVTGAFSDTAGGLTISSGTTLTVGGDFTLTTSGTFTATGSTVTLTGTSNNLNSSKTFVNLTINPATAGTITTLTNSPTVSGTLTVAADDTLSIGSGLTVTSNTTGTVTLNGTIDGTGTLIVQNSNLSTGAGAFSSGATVRFDATSGNISVPARPYGGNVVIYNVSTADRTITLGTATSQTITVTGNLTVNAAGTKAIQLEGATYNPAVDVTGNVSFTKGSSGIPLISSGTGTWTVSGNFDLTNGFFGPVLNRLNPSWDRTAQLKQTYDCSTYTDAYSCLSATASTLTLGDNDLTESGTICPAVFTQSHGGMKFSLASITDTNSIIQAVLGVNVASQIGETLYLKQTTTDTPDTGSCTAAGGMYDQLSGTTVYTTASYSTTGYKTNDLGATAVSDVQSRLTGSDLFAIGFINGGSGIAFGTINSVDSTTNKPVLVVSSVPSGTAPKLVMNGVGKTLTTAGNTLYDLTLSGSVTLANETVTAAGNVDLTGATITADGSTLQMTGTAATLTGGGATLNNLTIDPPTAGTTTLSTSDLTVSGLLTVATGDTLSLDSGRTLTLSGNSGTTLTLDGTISGSGRLTYQNSVTTLPTTGTLSTIVRFDAKNGDMKIPIRTYSGLVEALTSTGTARIVTAGTATSQTLAFGAGLSIGDGTNAVTFGANTYNPAINLAGHMTINANATYTKGTGTLTFDGTTAATYTDSTATPQNLGAVTVNKTDTVTPATNDKLTLASSMTVDTMTIDGTAGQADTLNLGTGGYTLTLANAGATTTVLTNSGTFTAGTSTVKFSATNTDGDINVPALAYNSIELAGAETYDLAGNLTSGNAVTGSVAVDSGATLDVTASNYSMEVGGNWTMAGTFTPRAGTVTFNGTAAQTVATGSQAFSGLTLNNTGTAGTANDDVIPSGTLTIGGALTITQGELKLSTNNPAIAVAGSFSIGTSGIFTKGTGTLTFNGTAAATYTDSTSTKQNLGTVAVNKTDTVDAATNDKLTLASSMTVDTITVDGTAGQADTLHLGSSGYTLKLANAGSSANVLTVNGTLTVGTSTVDYTATNNSGSINVVGVNYSSLSLSGAETYVVSDDITVSGTLTTSASSTLSVSSGKKVSHTGSSMTNNGAISGSGTLRFTDTSSGPGTGGTISTAVQYDASSGDIGSSTVDARTYNGPVDFYANTTVDRTITLASGTFTFSGSSANLTVTNNGTGTLTVDATANPDVSIGGSYSFVGTGTETLKTGTGTWTVSGNANFSNGILTATSGNTLVMDGSGTTLTTAGQSLSNLSIAGSVTSSGNVTLGGDLTINGAFTAPSGTLTIGGGFNNDGSFANDGGTVVFNASSGTQHIDADGTGSESYYNVTFSGSASWNMDSSVTVENTFTQSAGTIFAPQTTLAVAGSFAHSGGTFVGNGGTVLLNGRDQTISGTTTFANLTKNVTTARTLTFAAGGTQTITGTLTLQGADGAVLSLRSSSAGTQFMVDPQATRTIQYLDVQDSDNTNAVKIATAGFHVTNSGNNTGWAFPPNAPTSFSGTAISSTSILWTWTDGSSDETGFQLEAADGTVLLTVDTANTLSVTETGLIHGTSYTRQVVAYNADGVSDTSRTDTVTTRSSPPTIPELITPSDNALMNTLTPAFSFSRSTDSDDGMGTYTLLLNPGFDTAKTVFLGDVPTSGTQSQDFASVSGTVDTGTAQLTDDTLLHEGSNSWQVRATDTAENPSDSVTRSFVLDITKPTLTAFSLTPQAQGSTTSMYLSTSQQPTLTLTAQDNYQLQRVVVHFLHHRFLLGEEIGTTEEMTRTVLMSGTQKTVTVTPPSLLPYGIYTLRMETFDAAGNSSTNERSVTLQTPEKIIQRPISPGTTPSKEREKEIDQGTTPTKVPVDLTLPSLEKHAFERRAKESANLEELLLRFISKNWLDRFELSMNRLMHETRAFVSNLARTTGRHLAALFGFTSDALAQLRTLMQLPACGADCATQEQYVRATPLGATLNNILPKATGRCLVAWKRFQNHVTRVLIAGRKNRSHIADRSEVSIAHALQPVTKTVQWIGVGARVALDGIRGKYEEHLQITNVAIKASSPTLTTVTWTTNRVSKGKINYGQTISYGQEVMEQSLVLNHTVELKGLQPATRYYFEVLATDIKGEQTFDAYYGFTTPAP